MLYKNYPLIHCIFASARVFALVGCIILNLAAGLSRTSAQEQPANDPGEAIDHFTLHYGLEHPQLPALTDLGQTTVELKREGTVLRGAGNLTPETVRLDDIRAGNRFDRQALAIISEALVKALNRRGIYGVWVAFPDFGLEPGGTKLTDKREPGNLSAQVVVWASQLAQVRTLARGDRFRRDAALNNRSHRRIATESPLQPGASADAPGSLFQKEVLEHYLNQLSGEPGRRVEASLTSAGAPGQVILDYLVTETKPWMIFVQASNTGTDATDPWRIRVGFQDNQLTNHDDVLNLDAIFTPDVNTYGVFGSYRIPLLRRLRLDFRVYGSYGDFVANDASLQSVRFGGKNWQEGAELAHRATILHYWDLISAVGGNFNHYQIEFESAGIQLGKNSAEFFTPYASASLSHESDWWSAGAGLRFENALSSGAKTDPNGKLSDAGRAGADAEWTSLRWNVGGSVFLDPLFRERTGALSLVNELSLRVRGRMLLRGRRLIPQEQEPLGGALTVRGYPETVLSADEFTLATAEYAFHFPRSLQPGTRGKFFGHPFGWRPAEGNLRTDWDFIVRGFFDYGYRNVSPDSTTPVLTPKPLADRSLGFAGAGAGLELLLWHNVSLRCDVGAALNQLRDPSQAPGQQVVVRAGSVRAHFVSSVSW